MKETDRNKNRDEKNRVQDNLPGENLISGSMGWTLLPDKPIKRDISNDEDQGAPAPSQTFIA